MSDMLGKRHIRFCISNDNRWERHESDDKIEWTLVKTGLSLDDVVKEKEQVKNRNYLNLFLKLFKR